MTQSIVIQVGQCGNQIGSRFWDLALKEHSYVKKNGEYDNSMSTFFVNNNNSSNSLYKGQISGLKARAVLIDMEEGVVSEIMKSSIKNLFDHRQLITDVSGSGNNWATGNLEYGLKYHDQISENIRKSAELCDCLQCFFILHSMGGGTGSGLGTHVTQMLADEYPEVYRFVNAVFPSDDDDVITSPYNSVLGLNKLTEFADCVMPIENNSLIRMVKTFNKYSDSKELKNDKSRKPFDAMNDIVANLLLNLTSSSRFEGTLNVDLNEISMNLVPFPKLHYLIAAQSPLYSSESKMNPLTQPRRIDQIFSDSFTKDFQMIDVEPKIHTYLACALLVRGSVEISDIRRNIDRYRNNLKFVPWNREGWKVGHCSVAPRGQRYSLLNLSNNTSIHNTFHELLNKFNKLYKRKAHIHHYTQVDGFQSDLFTQSVASLLDLEKDYHQLEKQTGIIDNKDFASDIPRLQIAD